jgi:nucleotide-binding universal stress UspA family protein
MWQQSLSVWRGDCTRQFRRVAQEVEREVEVVEAAERRRACVLVGIDFSEGAMGALREGRWLAQQAGLELHVVYVTETRAPWRPDATAWGWLRAASLDPSMVLLREGLPWVEIIRHAREVSAAVVVLGSHGASGFQAMTLGSTASRVALGAPCPVLFVARWRESLPSGEVTVPSFHPLQEHP